MSALARWFKLYGLSVAGYDKTRTALTAELEAEGITCHFTSLATCREEQLAGRKMGGYGLITLKNS